MSERCPYCRAKLEKVPKRKMPCPKCGKTMYIRHGQLRTEFDALREDWLRYLNPLDITSKHFDEAREKLTNEWGHAPGFYDVVWRILNNVVHDFRSFADVENAYREMARVASFEGKDPRPYLADALKTSLQSLKVQGVKRVVIRPYADQIDCSTCDECRSLAGTELSVDEALASLPIPTKCTSDTGCRCGYRPA